MAFFTNDGSIVQANKGYVISFSHIPTGKCVSFKGFLTTFSDSYISDWQSETVYGRMDPIDVFRGTKRNISLSWVAVAGDENEARDNLDNVGLLIKMLYPTYTSPSFKENTPGPSIINQPPLMRLRFVNWAKSMDSTMAEVKGKVSFSPSGQCTAGGLVGHLGGISFTPEVDAGFFEGNGELFPKQINLSGDYTVLHEHLMGWYKSSAAGYVFGKNTGHNFPYGSAAKPATKQNATTTGGKNLDKDKGKEHQTTGG